MLINGTFFIIITLFFLSLFFLLLNTRLPSFRASFVCNPRVFSHANGFYHLDGVWFSFVSTGLISSHQYVPLATDQLATQVAKYSGHGNQHNTGPHQDQIVDIPAAVSLALRAKN